MKIPDYQAKLKDLAPGVAFSVEWSPDPHSLWDPQWGDQEEFEAFDVDVFARTIEAGEIIERFSSLGECWEIPDKKDPEIGGYLPQMLQEAAKELLDVAGSHEISEQLGAVVQFLKQLMQERWETQQVGKVQE